MGTSNAAAPSTADEPWGRPPTGRWGRRETLSAIGVAVVIGVLGGGAIYAATDTGSGHGGFGGPPPGGFGGAGGPGHSDGGRAAFDPAALHGEYVVADGHGGFQTEVTQVGTVTAVSATSITARSDDGFTHTYVIPPTAGHAADPFKIADEVDIRATRSGSTDTVATIGAPLTVAYKRASGG